MHNIVIVVHFLLPCFWNQLFSFFLLFSFILFKIKIKIDRQTQKKKRLQSWGRAWWTPWTLDFPNCQAWWSKARLGESPVLSPGWSHMTIPCIMTGEWLPPTASAPLPTLPIIASNAWSTKDSREARRNFPTEVPVFIGLLKFKKFPSDPGMLF